MFRTTTDGTGILTRTRSEMIRMLIRTRPEIVRILARDRIQVFRTWNKMFRSLTGTRTKMDRILR